MAAATISIERSLDQVRAFIDPLLAESLHLSSEAAPRLLAAMRHSLLAPGKRLRPALVLWAAEAAAPAAAANHGPAAEAARRDRLWRAAAPAAVAVEMIHAYSLVHDDLPAMDDDDLRRGLPTCHRAFDEATAILCGDALQALAFETLAAGMPTAAAARGCLVLARAAGAEALVGGQTDDLAAERGWLEAQAPQTEATHIAWMERIHRRKTGALFHAALELGGLSVGASEDHLQRLAAYGGAFGLAFQIADDILDATGTEIAMGKKVGKDAGRGKLTFPTVLGMERSGHRASALAAEAVAALTGMGDTAESLRHLACWIVARDH